ncbi:carbamoyltransferase HypF [Streptacidiphilus sp. PB12-B1b]|uniref:carbamoyltransferase HypF n=1 Tax=Streptacidiphilus sp. PB12-B1b TaxID=2705012 RepID=UPI0015F8E267|nr:carbamoyltransferase HypF [Streptacidiphilus sp. PB12-B1b]QMU77797.1 carbamoyltransferase HypF [Streptacidiphilus sp. PB12-B1b]
MTAPPTSPPGPGVADGTRRRRVTVRGVVQGVGFRPFVYTLATGLGLAGHVTNSAEGVLVEVEGDRRAVDAFCARIGAEAPPLAVVESVQHDEVAPAGGTGFTILASRGGGPAATLVSPDVATCADCLAELADPADRRHRHPFITCTNCGPRFTIVTGLPYDREHTTMARFALCPACAAEYADPADRRFHAQPVACHDCGPTLRLVPGSGLPSGGAQEPVAPEPVAEARRLLADGAILAVKGIGGYHLACDATDPAAVARLRQRKNRGRKPFALMAAETAEVERLALLCPEERAVLTGGLRPIVLLRRRPESEQALPGVAPGSPDLGFMLPYTPVHQLLLGLPGDPPGPRLLVMTSGNLSGEPIVTDDDEALARLAPLADAWLTHDRPIHVPCDDSVVRICDGQQLTLRRSRGYAPLPVALPLPVPASLAVGGDLKNVFCLGEGRRAWLSAHIGDMDDLATQQALTGAERQLESITGVRPGLLAADLHPRYRSGQWAERHRDGRPLARVQHHHAHVASAMAEHGLDGARRVIGVAFDGTGYGDDGAVWGGETLLADYGGYHRFAQLAYVPLPGGDAAVRRPYRMALAHLRAAGLDWAPELPCVRACPPDELQPLARQLERGLNCVPTSGMGRLFDAVSSLAGVCQLAEYEAQAAIELEAAALRAGDGTVDGAGDGYRFALRPAEPAAEQSGRSGGAELVADPAPVLAAVTADLGRGVPVELIAARFHAAVAELVRRTCGLARERHGLDTVALTGGVFANTLLTAACAADLRRDGFTVLRHRLVPPNDGGLALGQLMVAAAARRPGPPTAP